MGAFEYRQALEIRDVCSRHRVRYLFIGKSGAILLGYPDTTQDADLFLERSAVNGRAVAAALRELGFPFTDVQAAEIERGKDFVQLRQGPFDVDLEGDTKMLWSNIGGYHIDVDPDAFTYSDDCSALRGAKWPEEVAARARTTSATPGPSPTAREIFLDAIRKAGKEKK